MEQSATYKELEQSRQQKEKNLACFQIAHSGIIGQYLHLVEELNKATNAATDALLKETK